MREAISVFDEGYCSRENRTVVGGGDRRKTIQIQIYFIDWEICWIIQIIFY